jgi:hypothetical protein
VALPVVGTRQVLNLLVVGPHQVSLRELVGQRLLGIHHYHIKQRGLLALKPRLLGESRPTMVEVISTGFVQRPANQKRAAFKKCLLNLLAAPSGFSLDAAWMLITERKSLLSL